MPKRLDLTGQRFGRLTARTREWDGLRTYWHCTCDCGGATRVAIGNLRGGRQKSCGCILDEHRKILHTFRTLLDLTGHTYGKLTVISEAPKKHKTRHWLCRCECGTELIVAQPNLRGGSPKQCGECRCKLKHNDLVHILTVFQRGSTKHGVCALADKYGVDKAIISRIVNLKDKRAIAISAKG